MIRPLRPRFTKLWRRKYEVHGKKDGEDLVPEIDELDNRRMMDEVPYEKCENHIFSY